jgi:hypothetical protein
MLADFLGTDPRPRQAHTSQIAVSRAFGCVRRFSGSTTRPLETPVLPACRTILPVRRAHRRCKLKESGHGSWQTVDRRLAPELAP